MDLLRTLIVVALMVIVGVAVWFIAVDVSDRRNMINQAKKMGQTLCSEGSDLDKAASCYVDAIISQLGENRAKQLIINNDTPTASETIVMAGAILMCSPKCTGSSNPQPPSS